MTTYTVSGIATLPNDTTPLTGTWYVSIYTDSGAEVDGDGSFRAGTTTVATDAGTGAASVTLPARTAPLYYSAYFRSADRQVVLGPYLFELTANTTWGAIMGSQVTAVVTPEALANHIADTTGAHAATAISFTPAGTIAAINAQAAIEEVATEATSALSAHLSNPTTAHNATAIVFTPTGGLSSTSVGGALGELDTEKLAVANVDTDAAMAVNSDTKVASQKAVKTALSAKANVTEMPPTPERYGAAGNGVTDDTTALAAWAATGATGLALRPGSSYLTSATINSLSSTKSVVGNNAIIKASGTIADAIWKTPGTGTRLEYATFQDVVFDCNQVAQTALKLRWGGRVDLNNLICLDSTGDGFQLGDATAAARSYGIRSNGLRVDRVQATTLASGSRGVFIDAADDGRMINPIIVGYETGIRNNGGAWKFFTPHAFGHTSTTLPITCFDDNGPDNEWFGMEADSPSSVGLRVRNGRTRVFGGRVYANALVTDNTIVGIQIDPSPCDLTLSGVAFVAVDASHRIATDITGDLSIANITSTMWSAGTHVVTQNAVPRLRNLLTATVNGGTTLPRPIIEVTNSTTLASNGSVTINAATSQYHRVFLQANATSMAISNPSTGARLTIGISQDATGGRTYVWPTDCRFAGNSAPSDTTANRRTMVTFLYANSIWSEVSRSVAVPIS